METTPARLQALHQNADFTESRALVFLRLNLRGPVGDSWRLPSAIELAVPSTWGDEQQTQHDGTCSHAFFIIGTQFPGLLQGLKADEAVLTWAQTEFLPGVPGELRFSAREVLQRPASARDMASLYEDAVEPNMPIFHRSAAEHVLRREVLQGSSLWYYASERENLFWYPQRDSSVTIASVFLPFV